MGTTPCFYSQLAVEQLLLLLLILATQLNVSGGCEPGQRCCHLQDCWDLYETAQTALGHLTTEQREARCTSLRTFQQCIGNRTRHRGCTGNLSFHGSYKVVEKQMKQNNCSLNGTVFKRSDYTPGPSRPHGVCSYKGGGPYRYCDLFGDPHLRTFYGQFQTCKVRGAWPLISNGVLTVQVTNEPVGVADTSATATSKLTVVVNRDDDCASGHYLTYSAQSDLPLPSTFTNGRSHAGKQRSVLITEVRSGHHVEIYLRWVDTTIVVRLVGDHFTFGIKMPEDVMNSGEERASDIVQLCAKGCPVAEQIDYRELLSHSRMRDETSYAMSISEAVNRCRRVGVVDYYFDSCVFDLISTGDTSFVQAAQYAQQDAIRLFPQQMSWRKNRTSIVYKEISVSRGTSHHRTPYWAGCGSPGSLCLLLLTCLIISHTRTTFV